MINRLRYKCPPPLKPPIPDPNIYTKDGHIKEEILPFCIDLKIDPLDLCVKQLEDFAKADVSESVQTLRYNAYEAKRQLKIELLKGAIKDAADPRKHKYPLLSSSPEPRMTSSFGAGGSPLPNIAADKNKTRPLTTMEEKKSGNGGGLFITDLNSSKVSPQSTHPQPGFWESRGGKLRAETTKNVRRGASIGLRSGSMDTLADEEKRDGGIKGELKKEFERSLDVRVKEGERMLNASMLVIRQDQEYRDRIKEEYENRSKRWNKAMTKLIKERKKKAQDALEAEKIKQEKVLEIKKNEKAQRKQRYVQMCNKLEEVQKKRLEFAEEKARRMNEQSRVYEERLNSYLEKKQGLEEDNIANLNNLEEKLTNSELRKQAMISSRMGMKPVKAVVLDLGERKAMKAEEDENVRENALQKYMKDMLKRMKFEVKQERGRPKKDKLPSVIKSKEHAERLSAVRTKEKEEEKKAISDMREREAKSSRRIERQRATINEYTSERKEVNMNRSDIAKSYRLLIEEVEERRMDEFFMDYKEKMENYSKDKEDMRIRREKTQDIYRDFMDKRKDVVLLDVSVKSD